MCLIQERIVVLIDDTSCQAEAQQMTQLHTFTSGAVYASIVNIAIGASVTLVYVTTSSPGTVADGFASYLLLHLCITTMCLPCHTEDGRSTKLSYRYVGNAWYTMLVHAGANSAVLYDALHVKITTTSRHAVSVDK